MKKKAIKGKKNFYSFFFYAIMIYEDRIDWW